ncbi:unnamed protein product [Urochloa decumbens]|uniref:Uncharacterized protein n=1 Tax=Urochloa decumbens TaxID=240449 RepID=A0ABC9C2N2_9POAL
MYNPEQQQPPPHMAPPRMSFSSDFALEPPPPRGPAAAGRAADADFEFSPVGSRPMMAADQLFSKGRILPLREAARPAAPTTLRDELRAHDAGARRGSRWKELLGLKTRAHKKGAGAASAADAHVDLGEHGEAGE